MHVSSDVRGRHKLKETVLADAYLPPLNDDPALTNFERVAELELKRSSRLPLCADTTHVPAAKR